jgi:hypothetical protein
MDQNALKESLAIEIGQQMAEQLPDPITNALVQPMKIMTPKVVIGGVGDVPQPRLRSGAAVAFKPKEYSITLDTSPFYMALEMEWHDYEGNMLSPFFRQRVAKAVAKMGAFPGLRAINRLSAMETTNCYDGRPFFDPTHPYDDGIGGTGTTSNDTTATVANVTTTGITQSEAITLLGDLENDFVDIKSDTGDYPNVGFDIANGIIIGDPLNIQKIRQVTRPGASLYVGGSGAASPYAGYGTLFAGHPNIGLTKLYVFRTDGIGKPFWMPEYGDITVLVGEPDPLTRRRTIGIHRDFEIQPGEWTKGLCKTLAT